MSEAMIRLSTPPAGGETLRALLDAPDSPLSVLERVTEEMAARLARLQAALAEQQARAAELEQRLGVAEARLLVETMHAEGLAAQASHLLGLGAEALSAVEPSGDTYADGAPKTHLALVYEAAFDAKGRELGVEAPECFRDQ